MKNKHTHLYTNTDINSESERRLLKFSGEAPSEVPEPESIPDTPEGASLDINVEAERSGIQCKGTSRVTYFPPFSFGCAGQRGDAPMRCDDGRFLNVTWTADSCTSGTGKGKDDQGGNFNFVFGLSEVEAMDFINKRANLNKVNSNAEQNKSK